MVENEADLLQEDINKNNPPIRFDKDQTRFEIFLLFLNASGRSLSQIKGLNKSFSETVLKFPLIIDEVFSKRFANIKLNPQWLDKERGIVLTDTFNYYKNKMDAYHKVELLYNKNEISKDDLHKKVSEIFFSLDAEKINDSLTTAIGELHKGGFIFLFQKLSIFSKKYQAILDD